jgi:hypothetical protein
MTHSSTLLDFKTFCERYPFRPWTVRNYCSHGKIPHLKVGRKVFFRVEDIEQWLSNRVKPVLEQKACPVPDTLTNA